MIILPHAEVLVLLSWLWPVLILGLQCFPLVDFTLPFEFCTYFPGISSPSFWEKEYSHGKPPDVLSPCQGRTNWTMFCCFALELMWRKAVFLHAIYLARLNICLSLNNFHMWINSIFIQNQCFIFSKFLFFLLWKEGTFHPCLLYRMNTDSMKDLTYAFHCDYYAK